MRYVLAPSHRSAIRAIGAEQTLLAFDFDGTLAPIVDDRHEARMRPATRGLFRRLCMLATCAVVSGRARSDVRRRLGEADVAHVIGCHGADGGPAWLGVHDVGALGLRLAAALARLEGVFVEDAGPSLTIHYRASPRPGAARVAIDAAVSALAPGLRVTAGKRVVTVLPPGAPDKGDALRHLRRVTRSRHVLYVGDDVTDEDAFRAVGEDGLAVRIGRTRITAARYYLRSQPEIDELLRVLVLTARRPRTSSA